MTFAQFSSYLEKLEKTSSRLILIDILADLFKYASGSEIEKIIYLSQGRIAPFFEATEIGMAEKTVAESIAKAFNSTKESVLKLYGKLGDMGIVALRLASLAQGKRQKESSLSVSDVFETLTQIARTKGEGTVEKRQTLLSDLLKKLDSTSVKHLVRIPLGNMRLGIGDPTILDGLALAKLGDRGKRKLLEGAYNKTSDMGLIAKTLFSGGIAAVNKLKVQVGKPIRSELCERLPTAEKVIEKMSSVDVQYKYDGFRCVTGFTPVYVQGKGIIAIRDMKVRDKVLTKTGSFKTVVVKHKRTIKKREKLFAFKTFLGEGVKISEGHPILCFVEGKEVWKNIEKLKPNDETIFPLPQFPPDNPHSAPQELLLQTISGYRKTFILNENFYRFLGFWIGDGFTNDFHNTERVGLTFNAKKENKLADFYEEIIRETLQVSKITRYVHNGGLNLYWRDEPLKEWLSTYFRREWLGKMLPPWFSHVPKKHFKQFLEGWIESDGSTDKDGITRITTKEKDLAAFAQLIALSHSIIIGLHYIRIKNKTYYQLIIPKTTQKARIEKNRLIVKVLRNEEIKKRDPRIQLYDLQIEDDESFCIPMATLHNCQIHKNGKDIRIFSRNLEEMTHMFPELIKATLQQVKAKTAILDTEALAYQVESEEFLPFQETTKRRRKYGITEMAQKLPLKAFAFDILYKNGVSLIERPLKDRIEILKNTIVDDGVLIVSKTETVDDAKRLSVLLEDAISKGLEGLVVKRLESPYEAGGRNFNWVKLKRHSSGELQDTIDCVILGYIFGKGKRTAFGAGALLVGVYDDKKDEFVTVSKIGTGLTDEEWREIKSHSVWVEPKIVIEVLADEITKSPLHTAGLALRFPRLVSFRGLDKRAEDATTIKELVEMYKEQFKK
ncbi:ATP-dependent DNA ligase [Candidatus Microgenomates bacterium]|nr:ATP-dependent DNA ligase [Candidatus Microgenomates bacterium]